MCYFTTIAVNPSVHFDGGRDEQNAMNKFLRENYISNYLVKRFRCGRVQMSFIHRNRELHSYEMIGSKGAFFWDYSGYSYSGLGITEYTEFQVRKERSLM